MTLERVEGTTSGLVWYRFARPSLSGDVRGFRHALVTRLGGVSEGPFEALNLGGSVGDSPRVVEENHRRLFTALGLTPEQVVSPQQVHGSRVVVVGREDGGTTIPESDALITVQSGLALLLRFADCVPVLLYDPIHHAAGLAHAGWRGFAAGVLPATVSALTEHFGALPEDLWAGIGPAIGLDHYAVGEEVVAAVAAALPSDAQVTVTRGDQYYLDLPGAALAQLRHLGVQTFSNADICTACHTDEWFSHRAERGKTGRFGVLAMLT